MQVFYFYKLNVKIYLRINYIFRFIIISLNKLVLLKCLPDIIKFVDAIEKIKDNAREKLNNIP